MPNRWLFKEEPTHYSFQDLMKDKRAVWEGVKNPTAQMYLRGIRKGDLILYYHTGSEKAVVGIARAVTEAYPDPKATSRKVFVVEIESIKKLQCPVSLAAIKSRPDLKSFPLVRISRLSVMPVSGSEWRTLLAMAQEPECRD